MTDFLASRPTRARGLKLDFNAAGQLYLFVAPHAGAWIETQYKSYPFKRFCVAPHAGAWIETCLHFAYCRRLQVAPHAGAWIETLPAHQQLSQLLRRAPRGRVD